MKGWMDVRHQAGLLGVFMETLLGKGQIQGGLNFLEEKV